MNTSLVRFPATRALAASSGRRDARSAISRLAMRPSSIGALEAASAGGVLPMIWSLILSAVFTLHVAAEATECSADR